MKKTLMIFLAIITALMMQLLPCTAEDNMTEYPVSELGMYISFPDNWQTFYPDLSEEDKTIGMVGTEFEDLISIAKQMGVYLGAVSPDTSHMVLITSLDTDPSLTTLLSIMDISKFLPLLISQFESSITDVGGKVTRAEIYTAPSTSYIELIYTIKDDEVLQFATITDADMIYITLHAYGGRLTEDEETQMKEIIDSVHFGIMEDKADTDFLPDISADSSRLPVIPVSPNRSESGPGPVKTNTGSGIVPPASDLELSSEGILSKYTGNARDIILPDSVRFIDYGAFDENQTLESVVIPEGVLVIGSHAFSECPNLKSVTIPSTVVNIGPFAFSDCTRLSSVTIADGVRFIGIYAFSNSGLESIELPESIISISASAFYGNKDLRQVTLSRGLQVIGDSAFSSCESLQSIAIPESVTEIGDDAFWGCKNLNSVTLSEGLLRIGDYAFQSCDNLDFIELPDSLLYPGLGNFNYNIKVTVGQGTISEEWCHINEMDCTVRSIVL